MSELRRYFLDGYTLTVDDYSFLVKVQNVEKKKKGRHRIEDLPAWVFQSRLAIWLTDGKGSIYQRSLRGERFRKKLLSRQTMQRDERNGP